MVHQRGHARSEEMRAFVEERLSNSKDISKFISFASISKTNSLI